MFGHGSVGLLHGSVLSSKYNKEKKYAILQVSQYQH